MSILKTKTIGVFNKAEEVKETPVNMDKVQTVTNTNWITKETNFFTINFDSNADDADILQAILEHKSNKMVRVLFEGVLHVVTDLTCDSNDVTFYVVPADENVYDLSDAFNVSDLQCELSNVHPDYVEFSVDFD